MSSKKGANKSKSSEGGGSKDQKKGGNAVKVC